MNRIDALKILKDLGNSPNMEKHGLAVGFTMAALYNYFKAKNLLAGRLEMSKEDWEITGLLHDADYEATNKSLELHTEETTKKLKEINAAPEIIKAIRGHCDKEVRDTPMAKAVYAADELTGLVVACALVQPDKKLKSVTFESVKRKFRDPSFAKGANRDQIKTCQSELGIPTDEFIELVLITMQEKSEELGL